MAAEETYYHYEPLNNPLLNQLVVDNVLKYFTFDELKICRLVSKLWKTKAGKYWQKLRRLNPDPIHMAAVLSRVFQYLKFEDLDACRSVCSTWQKSARPYWEKNVPIVQLKQNCDGTRELLSNQRDADDLWALAKFNKFRLLCFGFQSNWSKRYKLWETHGKVITYLELKDCHIPCLETFCDIFFGTILPRLKTLKLIGGRILRPEEDQALLRLTVPPNCNPCMKSLYIEFQGTERNIAFPWPIVFRAFTQLEVLALHNCGFGWQAEVARVFQGIHDFKTNSGLVHPIHRLDVSQGGSSADWGMMTYAGDMPSSLTDILHLTSLLFSTDDIMFDAKNCYDLINSQRENLTRLNLTCNLLITTREDALLPTSIFDTSCPMQQLTRLDLIDCHVTCLKFLLACPKLEELNIIHKGNYYYAVEKLQRWDAIHVEYDGWRQSDKDQLHLPALTSFHCNLLINWDHNDLFQLRNWAPNLTSLLLHANNSSFEGICQFFPKLRRLFIYNSEVDDYGFTGVMRGLSQQKNGRRNHNLTDLQELEVLGIRDYYIPASPRPMGRSFVGKLSPIFAAYGILQMPKLKSLHITTCLLTRDGIGALLDGGFRRKIFTETFDNPCSFLSNAVSPF